MEGFFFIALYHVSCVTLIHKRLIRKKVKLKQHKPTNFHKLRVVIILTSKLK